VLKEVRFARHLQPSLVLVSKLLCRLVEQCSENRVAEILGFDDKPAPLLAHVDHQVAFRHVVRSRVRVTAAARPPEDAPGRCMDALVIQVGARDALLELLESLVHLARHASVRHGAALLPESLRWSTKSTNTEEPNTSEGRRWQGLTVLAWLKREPMFVESNVANKNMLLMLGLHYILPSYVTINGSAQIGGKKKP
jgi:hypothetical protein